MTAIEWRLENQPVYDPKTLREQLPGESAVLSQCNRFIDNRGYQPSVGYLLMTRKGVVELSKRQDFGLTLELKDGGRTFRREKLAIVETEAVWPNSTNGVTTETTPYVVKVADARYFARMSYVNQSFNRLLGDSEFSSERRSAHQIIKELWKALQPVFGFEITLRVKDAAMEDLAFHGVNAWDAMWHVLNFMGWSFRMTEEGRPEIFQVEQEQDSLRGGVELDGTYWLLKPVVPRTVVAVCQKRDYQWQRKEGQEAAGDAHRIDPVYELKIDTEPLLEAPVGSDDEDTEAKAISAHRIGSEVLWVPTTMFVGSNGPVNESRVRRVLREYAKRWFLAQTMLNRVTGFEFAGLYKKDVNSRWGAVVYGDTGEGLTTLVASTSVDTERARTPVGDFRPGPPNALDWAPYGREAWVKVVGAVNPSGSDENGIAPNAAATVQLRSGQLSQGEIKWNDASSVTAYNTTGKTIKAGQIGFAKWNYQIGERGVWCIVSVASEGGEQEGELDLPDWSSQCLSGELPAVEGYNDPTSIVVNRAAMFRLLTLSDRRMGLDFRRGPADTVLNTSNDGKMYWSDSPRSRNVWLSGSIWFGGSRFPTSSISTGGAHVQMPGSPTQSHQYVIAETKGVNSVRLGWHGPGMDGSIHVPKCRSPQEERDWFNYLLHTELLPYLCDYMKKCDLYDNAYGEEGLSPGESPDEAYLSSYEGYDNPESSLESANPDCAEWTFRNGLLVKLPGGKFPSPRTGDTISMSPAFNFNPCGSTRGGEAPPPTSGGGGDDPNQGDDDNPVLPDDEDGITGDLGGGAVDGPGRICGPPEQPIPCVLYDPWDDDLFNGFPDFPEQEPNIEPFINDPWRSS